MRAEVTAVPAMDVGDLPRVSASCLLGCEAVDGHRMPLLSLTHTMFYACICVCYSGSLPLKLINHFLKEINSNQLSQANIVGQTLFCMLYNALSHLLLQVGTNF